MALAAYVVVLGYVLLTPEGSVPSGLVQEFVALGERLDLPEKVVQRERVEFGLNVLAFVPLSLLGSLCLRVLSVSTWTASAFVTSLLVEAYQTTMPERMAAHSDVVANTAGAGIGAIVAAVVALPFERRLSEGRADLPDRRAATEQVQPPG